MEAIEKENKQSIENIKKEKIEIYEESLKGNFKRAEELFLNSSYQENEEIFSLYPRILYGQNRIQELLKVMQNPKYKDSILVKRECVKYHYLLKDYAAVLSIYETEEGRRDPKIFSYYVRIISKTKGITEALKLRLLHKSSGIYKKIRSVLDYGW